MPDTRSHRGPHPEDGRLFAPEFHEALRAATAQLSWLLTRGYAQPSALKLVGDRHNLTQRQRLAVMRCACSDQALAKRRSTEADVAEVRGEVLLIDGYNVLTTIEAALAGAVVLVARDETYRDIASVHGTWRRTEESAPALELVGKMLARLAPLRCRWLLDSPVSNSGRLRGLILEIASKNGWPWEVELMNDPDAVLCESRELIATADSVVLDRASRWINPAAMVVRDFIPNARVVKLTEG